MNLIKKAVKKGHSALSEYESKKVLSEYGIPCTWEIMVTNLRELEDAAEKIGFPLVLKGCAPKIAHKTEKGLIRVDIRNREEASAAFGEITNKMAGEDGAVLVQEMIKGSRELVVGLTRDAQFGPCVMFGLGGIFTEVLEDISFRVAPLKKQDALEMMREIRAHKILGAIRGMAAADLEMLAEILIRVGQIGLENEAVKEIDINPVILSHGKPVAVDALVVLEK
ncbi:MAG: acetate--CoA ligase family protein [Deltaproteobacteria bacterium]|nr:acetate--CoA ligase family protein [Deltaproteobacteria bacterium]